MKHILAITFALCLHAAALTAQTAYEIWFTAGSVRHHGLIQSVGADGVWQMRVKYYDTARNCTRLIEQQLRVEETNLGIRFYGHSVRDVLSRRLTRDYSADRLYVYRDTQGNMYSRNLDDQGLSGSVEIRALASAEEQREKLREFGW